MSTSTIIWIVVAVVIVLALVLLAVRMSGKKRDDSRRAEAGDMRQSAASDERNIQRHQADEAEQEALARQARAESDRQAATAAKLELQAQEFGERASGKQAEQRDQLRAADELDPDVPDQGRGDETSDGDPDGAHRRDRDHRVGDDPRDGTGPRTPARPVE